MSNYNHTYSLKELFKTDKVPTDDWKITEYDLLDDLDFDLSQFDMHFEYTFLRTSDEKYLELNVYKTKDNIWHLEIRTKKSLTSKENEQPPKVLEFKTFDGMMKAIHDIFAKY